MRLVRASSQFAANAHRRCVRLGRNYTEPALRHPNGLKIKTAWSRRSTFPLMAVIGMALVRRGFIGPSTNRMFLTFGALGLLLGLLWEAVE